MRTGAPRIVEVLDLISRQPNGVSVTELARLLSINKASASRLLASYVEAGLLERDSAQRHHPGMLLWSLGSRALQHFRPAEIARPIMFEATKARGIGFYFATVRGDTVYYVEQMGPGIPVTLLIHTVLPIHASGPGKAFLAFSDPEAIEAILDSAPYERFTRHTITSRDGMAKELEEIRRRGYSINRGEYDESAVGVAAPVYDFTGKPVATVGNTCEQDELTDEYIARVGPIVVEVGTTISVALGHTPAGLKVG
jgi:IclR family transcriptional regulator, KDG regulon repressor